MKSIPWAMIKPHEEQAMKNHCRQDLETLAKRGVVIYMKFSLS